MVYYNMDENVINSGARDFEPLNRKVNEMQNMFKSPNQRSPERKFQSNVASAHKFSAVGQKYLTDEDRINSNENMYDDINTLTERARDRYGFHIHDLVVDQDPATHFKMLPQLQDMLVKSDGPVNNLKTESTRLKDSEFNPDKIIERDDFTKSADFNKELYMREYGVQFAIPTSFVLNSHFFSKSSNLYFQVIKRVFPETMEFNQRSLVTDISKSNVLDRKTEVVLKLMKIEEGNQYVIDFKKLELGNSYLSCFSEDGTKFAYMVSTGDKHLIRVHVALDSKKPKSLLDHIYKFDIPDADEFQTNLKFMDKGHKQNKIQQIFETAKTPTTAADSQEDCPMLKFSEDGLRLIGYSGTKFFSLEYQEESLMPKICSIDEKAYKSILQLNFFSPIEEQQQHESIYIAAKVKGRYQIRLFEYHTEMQNRRDKMNATSGNYRKYKEESNSTEKIIQKIREQEIEIKRRDVKTQRVINYESAFDDPLPKVVLSTDFHIDKDADGQRHHKSKKKVTNYVLFSSNKEHYLLHFHDDGGFNKQIIPLMKPKYILQHVQEDEDVGGFYIICSRKEDWRLRVIHTHKQYLLIKMPAIVENGFLKVFQLQWNQNLDNSLMIDRKVESNLNILALDHNDSVLYRTTYYEIKEQLQHTDEIISAHKANVVINPLHDQNHEVLNVGHHPNGLSHEDASLTQKISLGSTKAFHMCWPRISYSDQQSKLYVANLYDGGTLQNLPLSYYGRIDKLTICCTYISPQQNLFILAFADNDKQYLLYRKSFLKESDRELKEPLLRYDQSTMHKGLMTTQNEQDRFMAQHHKDMRYEFEHPSMMFVRDEDSADDKGTLDSLYVFILHGMRQDKYHKKDSMLKHTLFQWREDQYEGNQQLIKVDYIRNQKVLIGLDNSLYYVTERADDKPWEDKLKDAYEVLKVSESDSLIQIKNKFAKLEQEYNRPEKIFEPEHEIKKVRKKWIMLKEAMSVIQESRDHQGQNISQNTYEIKNLVIGHMKTFIKTSYKEYLKTDELLSFDLDQEAEKIILLYRIKKNETLNKSHSIKRGDYKVKIFDIKSNRILIDTKIRNHLLIKLLISGNFEISGGHIYHSNSVVKIRYDLLDEYRDSENTRVKSLNESQLFDYYQDLMLLPPDRQISNLLFSPLNKRMCMLIDDQVKFEEPSILRITPYLHDRRIVLDVPTYSNQYQNYMTSMRVPRSEILENQLLQDKEVISKSFKQNNNLQIESMSFIIRINFSDQMMTVYSQNGIRVHQYKIEDDFMIKYGEPVASSNNGKYIVMKQPLKFILTQLENLNQAPDELAAEAFKFTIIEVTPFELREFRKVDVLSNIKAFINDQNVPGLLEKFEENNKWLFLDKVNDLQNFHIHIYISDNADVLVKLQTPRRAHQHFDEDATLFVKKLETVKACQFFYIMKDINMADWQRLSNVKGIKYAKDHGDIKQALYWVEDDIVDKPASNIKNEAVGKVFSVKAYTPQQFKVDFNDKYIIFFSNKKIFYINMYDLVQFDKYITPTKIDLQVEPNDILGVPTIQRVHPSPDPEKVAIVIRTDIEKCVVVDWNIRDGFEYNHNDVKMPFFITFDYKNPNLVDQETALNQRRDANRGECYTVIVNKDYTSISEIFCDLTVFQPDQKDIEALSMRQELYYGTETSAENLDGTVVPAKGMRFDGYNFNWILFDNYLAIPFSYMSFMIKDKIEKLDSEMEKNAFDIDAYNYMFNRSTSFMDGVFTRDDTDILEHALKKLEQKDPRNLGLIKFSTFNPLFKISKDKSICKFQHFQRRSALSIALTCKNATGVAIILEYMSKTQQDASECYFELYRHLIEYEAFQTYLLSLSYQTEEMEKTKTFKTLKQIYQDDFNLYAIYLMFKKMIFMGDWGSPLYSNLSDLVLQAKSSNTIMLSSEFFEIDLQKRSVNDKNIESIPEYYHDYPVTVCSIRCGWMFDQKHEDDFQIEHSNLVFLSDIVKSNNGEFFKIPYIQILTQFFYEKYLINQSGFAELFFLIADSVLVLIQFTMLHLQMGYAKTDRAFISVSADDYTNKNDWYVNTSLYGNNSNYRKDLLVKKNVAAGNFCGVNSTNCRNLTKNEWNGLQMGVNRLAKVQFIAVGTFANMQLFFAAGQLALYFWGLISKCKVIFRSSAANQCYGITFLIMDGIVKAIVISVVYFRVLDTYNRYRVIDSKVIEDDKKYGLTVADRIDCQSKPNCDLQADVAFGDYESQMQLLIYSIFINLLYTIYKQITRLSIFFMNMAKFIDLLLAMLLQLIPFISFAGIFIAYSSWIFFSLGNYQLKVDMFYAMFAEIYDDVPNFQRTAQSKDDYDNMLGNMVQDNEEAVPYSRFHMALLYVYRMLLGESDCEAFNLFKRGTDSPATILLWLIYVFITVIMMILLLNIIIAIMGQVQEDRTQEGLSVELSYKLSYALDQWHIVRNATIGQGGSLLALCSEYFSGKTEDKPPPQNFIIGVTSLKAQEIQKKEPVDNDNFDGRIDQLVNKIDDQTVDLLDVKNEILKMKYRNTQSTQNFV